MSERSHHWARRHFSTNSANDRKNCARRFRRSSTNGVYRRFRTGARKSRQKSCKATMLRRNEIKKKKIKNKRNAWKYVRPETFCSRSKRRPERKYWHVLIRKVEILFAGENRVFHGKRRPPSRACPLFSPAGNFFEKNSHGLRASTKSRANKNTGGLATSTLRSKRNCAGFVRLPLSFEFSFTFLSSLRQIYRSVKSQILRDRRISRALKSEMWKDIRLLLRMILMKFS